MLDAAFVSAILAVPPAIQAVRDLVRHKDPGLSVQIEQSLAEAERCLVEFADIGDVFSEAKSYHEKLTQIDLAMGELLEAASTPTRQGGFDPDAFERDIIFSRWRSIRDTREFLPSLIHFLQTVRRLDESPLSLDDMGSPIGGPKKFQLFVVYRNQIDVMVRGYNPKNNSHKEEICDKIDQFSHHLRHQILDADTIIIANALSLANTLTELKKKFRS